MTQPGTTSRSPVTITQPAPQDQKEEAVSLLANVVSAVLDEALLERVGAFLWEDSVLLGPLHYEAAVPVNRWERAASHFWDTLFTASVEIGSRDGEHLRLLLGDIFKAVSRCRAGDVRTLMDQSAWAQLGKTLDEALSR